MKDLFNGWSGMERGCGWMILIGGISTIIVAAAIIYFIAKLILKLVH